MDLTGTGGGESFNRKIYIYEEVVRTVCLRLEQSFQRARNSHNPLCDREKDVDPNKEQRNPSKSFP